MSVSARGFVERRTRLRPVPGAEWIKLRLVDDAVELWHATHEATGDPDEPIPFWGVAWGGGLAIARYLRDHPDAVAGRRVLDVACGSGLCAIAAAQAGAASVTASDVDRFAVAATGLNAKANRVRIDTVHADLLEADPPDDVDVVLAGDCWYEEPFASRATDWLRRCWEAGLDVLIGDPGRRHLDHAGLIELGAYDVRSSAEIEDLGRTRAWVHTFAGARPGRSAG
ncbi:MAG: 50S ribosomal protein L11 methyltransferase [Chloroflexota bacterium]